MNKAAQLAAIVVLSASAGVPAWASSTSTSSSPSALPAEVSAAVSGAQFSGTGKLTFFGLDVYESSLWVAPSFRSTGFENHAFALELHYLRNFSANAIAQRSLEEMQRLEPLPEQKAEQWQNALREALPNVKNGDRLIGLHRPGVGVVFWSNGKRSGEVRDAEFARQFFAIWLSPKTSEPKLRRALLAKVP